MAIVEIMKNNYYSVTSIENLVKYVTDYNKTHGLIGAIGTNPNEVDKMISQMMAVKYAYGKSNGYRQARHIVVSFKENEVVSQEVVYDIAYDIARFYADRYQICFGVHWNTDNLHIHFVQNTVSYVDGKLFSGNWVELNWFRQYVNCVVDMNLHIKSAIQLIEEL